MSLQPMTKTDLARDMAQLQDKSLDVGKRSKALSRLVDTMNSDIRNVLPKHLDFERMKQLFIQTAKSNPKLMECDPASLIKSLITAASMGLEPDPYFGQIYLLPFGKNVQVIPGYKGLMKLVRNSGEIASICCEAIHENDQYEYQLGSDPKVEHRPFLGDRGAIVAFYCVVKFKDGSIHVEFMTKGEVDRIRMMSPSVRGGKGDVWNDHYEEMGKKTVFRRAVKRLPISLSPQAKNAIIVSDAADHGRTVEIDTSTGEVLDIWAEESIDPPAESTTRLDSFASETEEVTA